MLTIIILLIVVLSASAICSMVETAILSISLIRTRILYEQGKKNAKDLVYLKDNITDTIATIVILNNAINIVGSVFIGHKLAGVFGNQWLGIISTFLTLAIIIVSEIIPKTIGERYKTSISLFFAKGLKTILILSRPIVFLVINSANLFKKSNKFIPNITEEEIRMMLKLARAEGSVEMDEEILCNRVFKLNDIQAIQIMKPIHEIFSFPANKTLFELKENIINSKFSRIAVYEKDPLKIIGFVQQRILLREIAKDNYSAVIRNFMTEPIHVNARTKGDILLEKFQAYHQHVFIIQDDRKKDIGLVTMEDVLEELFGEIYDEKDTDHIISKIRNKNN